MFSRLLTLSLVLGSVTLAPVALAGDGYRYERANYLPSPSTYDFARVVSAEPIVRKVRVEVPQRECWTEDQYEEPPRPAPTGNLAGPTILGGIIGGVIGSQFGSGSGRRAATAAGALVGSAIGNQTAARRQAEAQAQATAYEPRITSVERCGVRYTERYDERIEGYDVEYEYAGQRHQTRLPYDPGDRIRVRVAVSPAEDGYSD